jgi:hypothetical protein
MRTLYFPFKILYLAGLTLIHGRKGRRVQHGRYGRIHFDLQEILPHVTRDGGQQGAPGRSKTG